LFSFLFCREDKDYFSLVADSVGGFEEVISDFEEANLDIDVERL
jgi:hypothetical protein